MAGVQIATLRLFTNKRQPFTPINSKVALVNRQPIPYMESINKSSTAYVPMATSTICGCVWAFHINCLVFF